MYFNWCVARLLLWECDDFLYRTLSALARSRNRSVNQEITAIIQQRLAGPDVNDGTATDAFLELSGTWDDEKSAEQPVLEIYHTRQNSIGFEDAVDG
jgi:hypothetical protein